MSVFAYLGGMDLIAILRRLSSDTMAMAMVGFYVNFNLHRDNV